MNKALTAFLFFCIFSTTIGFSQVAYWQKYLGGEGFENGKKLLHLPDGTLLIAGDTYSNGFLVENNHGDSDIILFKYSTQGNIFWKTVLGGSQEEQLGDVIQTKDGGFLLVGKSNSSDGDLTQNRGGSDIWIVKLDEDGKKEWSKTLGGINDEQAFTAIELEQGGYLIGGEASSHNMSYFRPHHGGLDGWVGMFSESGETIWEKQYGGLGNERVSRIHQLSKDKYLIIGSTDSKDGDIRSNMGQKDAWLFTLDQEGEWIWGKTYGGSANDIVNSSQIDPKGNFLMAGTTFSADGQIPRQQGQGDSWIFKVRNNGELLWSKTYGGGRSEGFMDVKPTRDRGYILCGMTKSRARDGDIEYNAGFYEGWIVKCDIDGNRIWSRTIGYPGKDVLSSLVEVPEGGYLCLGYATQGREGLVLPEHKGSADFWICNISDPERQGVKPYVTPPVLIGSIRDRSNDDPVKALLTLTDNRSLDSLNSVESNSDDGEFAMVMPTYGLVSIGVLGEGYMFHGQDFLMDTVIDRTTIQRNIILDPIEVGAKLILENTYFNTGKWDLLEKSFAELQRVKKFLQLNPRVRVQISGHTDNTGNRRTKEALSLNRANSVRSYLISQGIPGYQMTVKGFGMYKPIASNKTAAGRAKNRRVEIEIIKK